MYIMVYQYNGIVNSDNGIVNVEYMGWLPKIYKDIWNG